MGNEDHGHATFGLFGEQKVGDLFSGLRIKITCRFVGDQDGWRRSQCTGDGDTLLLATRKLAWIVVQALTETNGDKFASGNIKGFGTFASSSGTATFSRAVILAIR